MKPLTVAPELGMNHNLDLREGSRMEAQTISRQTRNLPIHGCGYGYFIAGPGHFTEREYYRSMCQIFVTHRGRGRFTVGGRVFYAEPNTVVVLDIGKPHRYETAGELWEHEWVNFSGDAWPAYAEWMQMNEACVHPIGSHREIAGLVRKIGGYCSQTEPSGYVHAATDVIRLLDAIYALVNERQRMRLGDRRDHILRSVEFIDGHYAERLTLDRLAEVAYLSKYYYTRAFHRFVGMTPYEYLNTVRLSAAKNLLLSTLLSVEEIGWRTGFGGGRNLIRQFRAANGISPGAFRKCSGMTGRSDGRSEE